MDKFLEYITWDYLLVVALCFAVTIYGIVAVFSDKNNRDDDGDDDGGEEDWDGPLPDLPDGVITMDEHEQRLTSVS